MTNNPAPANKPKRPRRLRRAALFTVAGLLLLWLAVAQSGVLAYLVVPALRTALKCDVQTGRVTMNPAGQITVRDVRLTVPTLDGPAAEFLVAPKLVVTLDWLSIFRGAGEARSLVLREPHIRLSIAPDQSLNVAALRAKPSAIGPRVLPTIRLERAILELGEHDPFSKRYDELFVIRVAGEMNPSSEAPQRNEVILRELLPQTERTVRNPTFINGWIDISEVAGVLTISDVDLASWSERSAPLAVRDLWDQLDMRGRIRSARFAFTRRSLLEAQFALDNVDMRIPLREQTQAPDPEAPQAINMANVSGELRFDADDFEANLAGTIEDLACEVYLRTDGLSFDAPLVCNIRATNFILEKSPQLMPFAPPYVERIFRRFSGPTAEVSGVIRVERGPPIAGVPADLDVSGAFTFEHGRATYEYFPYPFHNMRGTINFDSEQIDIVSVSARGPSGSSLLASGRIAPPKEGAAVDLSITVADAPLDDAFYAAMPPSRAGVLDAIFHKPDHQRYLDDGLIIPSARAAELSAQREQTQRDLRLITANEPTNTRAHQQLEAQLARLDEQLATPVFDLGGKAAIRIRVLRELGLDTNYDTSITLRIEDAGIIPQAFPYPIRAKEARIQIDGETAHVSAPLLTGLTGGAASLSGSVIYATPNADYQPSLDIRAQRVPVDPLLIAALPTATATDAADQPAPSPREIVRRLAIDGAIDCIARIRPESSATRTIGYTIDVGMHNLRAMPPGATTAMTDLSGNIRVTPDKISLNAFTAQLAGASLAADIRTSLGDNPTIEGSLTANQLNIENRFEHFVAAVVPPAAERIEKIRADHAPAGALDVLMEIDGPLAAPRYTVNLSNLDAVSFTALDTRATCHNADGIIAVTPDRITFNQFTADLNVDRERAGQLAIDGNWSLTETEQPAQLTASLNEAPISGPAIRAVINRAGEGAQSWINKHNPRGVIDASADVRSINNALDATTVRVAPRILTIEAGEATLDFTSPSGWVRFAESGAHFEALELQADQWSTTISGNLAANPSLTADLSISGSARGLPEPLLAALPDDAAQAIRAINLQVGGVINLRNAQLEITEPDDARRAHLLADLTYSGVSVETGVKVDQLAGAAQLEITTGPEPQDNSFRATLAADTLRAFGVDMSDARATVQRQTATDPFSVVDAFATAHRGRMIFNALVLPPDGSIPGRYQVDVQGIDINMDSLLNQVSTPDELTPEKEINSDRGRLDLQIAVEGEPGNPDARRGRGLARLQGGDVLGVPGALSLIRLSNLQLPFGEPLSIAYADFHIVDDTVQVTDLQLASSSLAIVGSGTVALPDLALDLSFYSRGTRRIPIVSDLIEGVRDEIVTAVVRGTLSEPDFTYEQFAGTRKMLDAIFSSRRIDSNTAKVDENQ